MDLWIRSQDKEMLIKCEKIMFEKDKDIYAILNYIDTKDWFRLGLYKSKEKALEVLDEIQMHIKKQDTDELLVNSDGIITGQKHYGRVYEMPEE